jgi:predicted TIM-barrel fold metal-dependent hydrolase
MSQLGEIFLTSLKIYEMRILFSTTILLMVSTALWGQRQLNPADTLMLFEYYNPPSSLIVPEHPKTRAKYPFIDVHNHQWRMSDMDLNDLIVEMEKLNMGVMVNLSGRNGATLNKAARNVEEHFPNRFIIFANVDFNGIGSENWTEKAVAQLEADVRNGANGLKVFKNLGFSVIDTDDKRVAVDDERLDPIWAKCGELGIPVLIHTGDPHQFWQDRDANNERWLELKERPRRYRDPEYYPSFEEMLAEQHRMFRKHPNTKFINAHLGWLGNDLARLGKLMDEIPNMYTEIGAVLAELGRQPRMAQKFLTQYQDRVMFGKDSWNPEEYYVYFRVLETEDEYFDYYRKRHAYWKMYGLGLDDEVLRKIYYKNALKVIPNIDQTLFPTE